jgi:Type III restriction enzyme, res subunit
MVPGQAPKPILSSAISRSYSSNISSSVFGFAASLTAFAISACPRFSLTSRVEVTLNELLDTCACRAPLLHANVRWKDMASVDAPGAYSEILQLLDVVRHTLAAVLVIADEADPPSHLLPEPDRRIVTRGGRVPLYTPLTTDWQVSPETARLLQHRRHHAFPKSAPAFLPGRSRRDDHLANGSRAEARQTRRKVLVARPRRQRAGKSRVVRLALKLATGTGKTTVMAMLIAWQTINAVRHPSSKHSSRGFLVIAPGITRKWLG